MRFRTIFFSLLVICFAISFGLTQGGSSSQQIADEVIAIVKAQWAAEAQKNVTEAVKNIADDYTEFNPDFATRVEGKAIATRFSEAQSKDVGQTMASEMLNAKVQVYGDVAILSYNYAGMSKTRTAGLGLTRQNHRVFMPRSEGSGCSFMPTSVPIRPRTKIATARTRRLFEP